MDARQLLIRLRWVWRDGGEAGDLDDAASLAAADPQAEAVQRRDGRDQAQPEAAALDRTALFRAVEALQDPYRPR